MLIEIKHKNTYNVLFSHDCVDNTRILTLEKAIKNYVDLSGADLSGYYLGGVKLNGAILTGANLSRSILYGANLTCANLIGADLSECSIASGVLMNADLSGANLTDVNLVGAILTGVNLNFANLAGVSLTNTIMRSAYFGIDVKLSEEQHLQLIKANKHNFNVLVKNNININQTVRNMQCMLWDI